MGNWGGLDESGSNFSERFGFKGPDGEITIREDAPDRVRDGVIMLGYSAGLGPGAMRDVVCDVLLTRPDPNNWSPGNVENEVHRLVDEAPWYRIYDMAERLYAAVGKNDYEGRRPATYERRLNELFRELGVGWRMEAGLILVRGSEAFATATRDAVTTMRRESAPTAAMRSMKL